MNFLHTHDGIYYIEFFSFLSQISLFLSKIYRGGQLFLPRKIIFIELSSERYFQENAAYSNILHSLRCYWQRSTYTHIETNINSLLPSSSFQLLDLSILKVYVLFWIARSFQNEPKVSWLISSFVIVIKIDLSCYIEFLFA